MKTNVLRIFCLLLTVLLVSSLLCSCQGNGNQAQTLTSVSQLTNQRIGVQTGTLYEEDLVKTHPDIEIAYFTVPTDMVMALQQGKIDGFLIEDITFEIEKHTFPWLELLDGAVISTPLGAAISEHTNYPTLHAELSEFISQIQANGTADDMKAYWLTGFDPDNCVVDRSGITGEKGTLGIAVESGYEPFSYYGGGELKGYDIDFIYRFCRQYGYAPEFHCVEYDAIPVGISTGKFDVGMSVVMSDERTEAVIFAGPYLTLDICAAVKGSAEEKDNWLASLGHNFEKTFIKEDRWMLFLEGAGTTLLITCLSAIFGTLLGFILYILCKKSVLFDRFNGFINWVIGGMPTVLLLMVLYYLVFVDWADIGGVWVAIVCFTILFGYGIFEILTTSVSAVGKGQEEGARALGYSENQAFFQVVLPQALRIAFPQIKSQVVGLIKETSIVGYISIADLTRMSDIVRGRTYEAFFPLVTTTIIYFVLIWLILFVIRRMEIEMTFRPTRVNKIKKGIQTK